MGTYQYNVASDEDGNDYPIEKSMDSPGTSEEEVEADDAVVDLGCSER